MKRKNRDILTKALRSGRYKQGHERLCARGEADNKLKYCCLGVAYDVLSDSYWEIDSSFLHSEIWKPYESKDSHYPGMGNCIPSDMPDDEVLKEIDMTKEEARELAVMNDEGKTFGEIADWIEENM